jgi:hypothetical protein
LYCFLLSGYMHGRALLSLNLTAFLHLIPLGYFSREAILASTIVSAAIVASGHTLDHSHIITGMSSSRSAHVSSSLRLCLSSEYFRHSKTKCSTVSCGWAQCGHPALAGILFWSCDSCQHASPGTPRRDWALAFKMNLNLLPSS